MRRRPPRDQRRLFDAPLRPAPPGEETPETAVENGDDPPIEASPPAAVDDQQEGAAREAPGGSLVAARLRAALGDAAVLLAAAAALAVGAHALGAPLTGGRWAALAAPLLTFSFLYTVVALAFWGRTPGAAAAGLVARSVDGRPLSFGQAAQRWTAGLLTLAGAGLPALVALSGRSLGDRLSGSTTRFADRG